MKTDGSDAGNKQLTTEKKQGTLGDWMNGNKAAFLAALPKILLMLIDLFNQQLWRLAIQRIQL